jgi:hypothetical protein
MYFIYITSITFVNKETDFSTSKDMNTSDQNLLTSNTPVSEEMSSPNNPFRTTNVTSSDVTKDVLSKESQKYFPCEDELKTEGLWRNLSRRYWPELLDLYGVNVMDR